MAICDFPCARDQYSFHACVPRYPPNASKTDERCATCWLSADPAYLVEAIAGDEVVVLPEGDGRRRRGL
jgi:hypothetical protein